MIKVTLVHQWIGACSHSAHKWLAKKGVKLDPADDVHYDTLPETVLDLTDEEYDQLKATNIGHKVIPKTIEQEIDALLPNERKQVMSLIRELSETRVPEDIMSAAQQHFTCKVKHQWRNKPKDATHYSTSSYGVNFYLSETEPSAGMLYAYVWVPDGKRWAKVKDNYDNCKELPRETN